MVVAHECGIADRLDLQSTTPRTIIDDVSGENPLGQIPTLVTDEGEALFDSDVIIEYLNDITSTGLMPGGGQDRWKVRRLQATGQGLITAVNQRFNEQRRPDDEQSPAWIEKKDREIRRVLDYLEAQCSAGHLADTADFGTITVGCALSYVDLRWPEGDWMANWSSLAAWYDHFAARPSMQATPLVVPG